MITITMNNVHFPISFFSTDSNGIFVQMQKSMTIMEI